MNPLDPRCFSIVENGATSHIRVWFVEGNRTFAGRHDHDFTRLDAAERYLKRLRFSKLTALDIYRSNAWKGQSYLTVEAA